MGATDEVGKAATWREEVRQLFGLRWDTLVDWTVRVWLATWFWTAQVGRDSFAYPSSGPISWLIDVLRGVPIDPPGWLIAIPSWLASSEHAWSSVSLAGLSAAFATLASSDYRRAGLRFLAFVAMLMALEARGDPWPLLWAALLAAAPAALALIFSGFPSLNIRSGNESYYDASRIVAQLRANVIGLYAAPVGAPLYLVYLLVAAYRTELDRDPRAESVQRVAAELQENPKRLADADALTVLTALGAILTSQGDARSSRSVMWTLKFSSDELRRSRARQRDDRRGFLEVS